MNYIVWILIIVAAYAIIGFAFIFIGILIDSMRGLIRTRGDMKEEFSDMFPLVLFVWPFVLFAILGSLLDNVKKLFGEEDENPL